MIIINTFRIIFDIFNYFIKRTRRIINALKTIFDFFDHLIKKARLILLHFISFSSSLVIVVRFTSRVNRFIKLVLEHVISLETILTSLFKIAEFEKRYTSRLIVFVAKLSLERNNEIAIIKIFKLIKQVVDKLFDKVEKINARLVAINENTKINQFNKDVNIKNRIVFVIIKFANEFKNS